MEYTTLGSTGMEVSRICLGCMSFGSPEWRDWVLGPEESREIVERAIDLGINFFDTANAYSNGESERVVGDVLGDFDRDELVVATKTYFPVGEDRPNAGGLSRKTIDQELAASLDRLGMDAVDLYQVHRWDEETAIEETVRALDDAVRRGRTRYVGASSMWATQFAEARHAAERLGATPFQTMQNHYNLVYREEEREMLPYCRREGVGVMPWSPHARGYLTRPHEDLDRTDRGGSESLLREFPYRSGGGPTINERVREVAADEGATMAQIALAWLLEKEWVDAPIVGTTSVEHLEEAVEALELSLSSSDVEYLEEPYEPVPVAGHT